VATIRAVEREAWVERARELAPVVAQWRDACDRERHIPRPLFEAIRNSGLFALTAPRSVDGADVDQETIMAVTEELSQQDGAVGWNVAIAAYSGTMASHLPARCLEEVYRGGPSAVLAGAIRPLIGAAVVPDGYRVMGRWSVGSGCHQADWMVAPCIVTEKGQPRLRPDASPEMRMCVLPSAECEILDTWYTVGLRGTGSHDWQVADVFVPEDWSFPITAGSVAEPGSFHLKTFMAYAAPAIASVSLGIARDAIDSFCGVAAGKTPEAAKTALAHQHTVHERVGRAEALVSAARAFLYGVVRALPASPDCSTEIEDETSARIRLASAYAAQSAAEAVDLMFNAAGTSSVYLGSRLERCFRDVHMVPQHVAVAASNIEMVGQYLLGFGLQMRR
jgi:alkylation response protein AidB-like acyl-CoA dehydrogenase